MNGPEADEAYPTAEQLAELTKAGRMSATRWGEVALTLIREYDLTVETLAATTGLKPSTVRGRLTRARRAASVSLVNASYGDSSRSFTPAKDWHLNLGFVMSSALKESLGAARWVTAMQSSLAAACIPRQALTRPLGSLRSVAAANRVMPSGHLALGAVSPPVVALGKNFISSYGRGLGLSPVFQGLASVSSSGQATIRQLAGQMSSIVMDSFRDGRGKYPSVIARSLLTQQTLPLIRRSLEALGADRASMSQLGVTVNEALADHEGDSPLGNGVGAEVPGFDRVARHLTEEWSLPTLDQPYRLAVAEDDPTALQAMQHEAPELAAQLQSATEELGSGLLSPTAGERALAWLIAAMVFLIDLGVFGAVNTFARDPGLSAMLSSLVPPPIDASKRAYSATQSKLMSRRQEP